MTGTVVDNVGVVPGATVTVTNAAASVTRTAVTDAQGGFRIVSLPAGRYVMKVNMQGFKQLDMADLPLQLGEVRDLGKLALSAGGVQETVNVTAEVTPVQTSSSALQKNLSSDLLTSVQVKGRDIFGMLKILPGITDAQASRDFTNWASGRYLSINGGDSLYKNTTIDGVPVGEEGGNGTTHITPNIDSVAEVNVITSGYTAENGRMASGQVVMVTKSGTNQFKGSAWYNGRRDWMNKNDYFRIKSGNPKPFFAVDLTGFSIGGPVIIPGLINSRTSQKKVFFFGSTEYTRDIRPTNVQYTALPTALERAGDFSQTFYCANASTNPCTRDTAGSIIQQGGTTRLTLTNPYGTSGVTDFFCAPGTGGLSGVGCAGTTSNTGIINPKYFSSMGRSILNLLPLPNNLYNPASGQAWTANNASDTVPEHVRSDIVTRVDVVLSEKTRFSVRGLFDRDDNTVYNDITPGGGDGIAGRNGGGSDNVFPGNLISGALTQVIKPTVVNELTLGYSLNHYGFKRRRGPLVPSDYTSFYRDAIGIDPPRLAPFGAYKDPPDMDDNNEEQYPYFPYVTYGGGNATNNGYLRPAGSGSRPFPTWNRNYRFTVNDDLSVIKGRHSFKFGLALERDSKTEPGSSDYAGSYNFAHSGDNPLSTGNGYANALLGVFTSYTERDRRIDREDMHWLGEAYAQDTWRATPRVTVDYGIRFTHTGSMYEVRGFNSGFNPSLYNPSQAAQLFMPYCKTGVAGNVACSSSNRAAQNPVTGAIVSQAFAGTVVPAAQGGTGSITNGMFTGGLPGLRVGEYDSFRWMEYGPRFGFAWDVTGSGKTAIRGAAGVFYNFTSCCPYPYNGGPLISVVRQVLNANIADISEFNRTGNLAVTPQGSGIPLTYNPPLYGQDIPPGDFRTSKHYQANFAVQRDLGFNTVVEVAYVGNFGRNYYQAKTTNNVPINVYAKAKNLFNNETISSDFLRRDYPGIGALSYVTSQMAGLNYNSLQVSVNRRLTHGLQMGAAYTLAKGEGMRGWDFMTEELGGMSALRDRYYGPQITGDRGQERRHVLVFHYSYQIPTLNVPVAKYVLAGWEASGVTTMVTGDAINPSCGIGSGISGVANNDPSLTGVSSRCELVPGTDLLSGYDANPSGNAVFADQMHFNVNALQRPLPLAANGSPIAFSTNGQLFGATTGNLGNVRWGALRNPGWSNWDFTLARRLPVKVGRGGNVRIQLQFYNLFNQIEYNTLNASYTFTTANATGGFGGGNTNPNTGKYTATQNPFNFGVTIRFDY